MLKVEKVNKSFWWKQVLFDVETSIEAWEIVWILWPNGAWKSTTMKIMTWFYKCDTWDVKIENESIFANDELKRKIGYLPEVNPLYEDMWVDEFLLYTSDLKWIKDKDKEVDKVLWLTWLKDKKLKFINTLSKWYKQRVWLASALIWDPEILILDEPTEWLDPNQRDEIKNLIKNLWETKTILISSHVLSELTSLVNRVIIISDWKIKLDDSVENIELSHNKKMKLTIIYDWKIDKKELKEKFKNIEEIKEDKVNRRARESDLGQKKKLEILTNKDIRRDLLVFVSEKYDILEFYSKKIDLSDVFFETIK